MHHIRDTPTGTETQLDKLLAEHTAAFSDKKCFLRAVLARQKVDPID